MLASHYFSPASSQAPSSQASSQPNGSFNLAIQDGPDSGQTVPHLHMHIIPRPPSSSSEGDGIYDRLQGEEGNVGGGLWDQWLETRPEQKGRFPKIEDSERRPRSKEDMERETGIYRGLMGA
jgi:bis(5'-adenosyl)-triphosphatase